MEQQARHRRTIATGDNQLRAEPLQVESNDRCPGVGSLYLCEWEKIDNNDHSDKVGKSAGIRTQAKRER